MTDAPILTEYQAAELTGFSIHWFRERRYQGLKPDYLRIGKRSIRYERDELLRFMQSHRVETREGALA